MAFKARYICVPPVGIWRYLLPALGVLALLASWQVAADMRLFNPQFLPSPGKVWDALVAMFTEVPQSIPVGDGSFRAVEGWWDGFLHTPAILHGQASVGRILHALWNACALGLPLGILMGAFWQVEGFLKAIVEPMRNAPIIAFLPLFIEIYGVDDMMKVQFLAFGTVVYVIPATFDAVRNVPYAIVDKAVDLGFRPLGALWHYILPAAMPRIFDGIRLCTGISWTYLVAAEVMNVTTGLGAAIQNARRFSNTPKVYASILIILTLGVLTDLAFRACQKWIPMLQQEKAS